MDTSVIGYAVGGLGGMYMLVSLLGRWNNRQSELLKRTKVMRSVGLTKIADFVTQIALANPLKAFKMVNGVIDEHFSTPEEAMSYTYEFWETNTIKRLTDPKLAEQAKEVIGMYTNMTKKTIQPVDKRPGEIDLREEANITADTKKK